MVTLECTGPALADQHNDEGTGVIIIHMVIVHFLDYPDYQDDCHSFNSLPEQQCLSDYSSLYMYSGE